uniref:Uncharacterized protein n=1 Tax=Strongyloides papillosus TaxID=174720 RepID=A0A0N5C625_STREA
MDELDMLIALEKKIQEDLLIVNEVVDKILAMQHGLDEKYEEVYRLLNEKLQYKDMFHKNCKNMDALVNSGNNDKIVDKKNKILQAGDDEFTNRIDDKKDETTQVDDSEFIDKIDDEKDETLQVGDGCDDSEFIDKIDDKKDEILQAIDGDVINKIDGKNNETIQTSDGNEVTGLRKSIIFRNKVPTNNIKVFFKFRIKVR